MRDSQAAAEAVFRRESGRILAALIRISGSFDLAEEAMQEAFAAALANWSERGIPDNPGAWITAAAHRKLIDQVRRARTRQDKQADLAHALRNGPETADGPMHFPDDRLRLIFTCCHPAINRAAQVALTLRTLCGLSTPEIARAFLLPEATLAQRLVRAKQKIRDARIPYEVPPPESLAARLGSVQSVVYLVFNEGYSASSGGRLIRSELCAEAIRLARMLRELMPDQAENAGLLALMILQDSRRDARIGAAGELILLEEQDRSQWDRAAIAEGLRLVNAALRMGAPGPYQIQAAIAAVHSEAGTAAETDWRQIAALYADLLRRAPSAVIALNHAVAVAMSEGLERGLSQIEAAGASGELDRYHLFHAARRGGGGLRPGDRTDVQ